MEKLNNRKLSKRDELWGRLSTRDLLTPRHDVKGDTIDAWKRKVNDNVDQESYLYFKGYNGGYALLVDKDVLDSFLDVAFRIMELGRCFIFEVHTKEELQEINDSYILFDVNIISLKELLEYVRINSPVRNTFEREINEMIAGLGR